MKTCLIQKDSLDTEDGGR